MKILSVITYCVLISFGFSKKLIAQQPPSGLQWYQIKTPSFRIVFPDGFEEKAQEVASLMEHVAEGVSGLYHIQPRRVSIYLNNLTAIPNAYAALGPRHMQWYAHPPQNVHLLGSADWFRLLAIHEYRHVVQFDYLNRNLLSYFSALTGDFGRALGALTLPLWYYEGDAIAAETALTNFGRGRIPEFEAPMKAIVLDSSKRFTYNQAYLRSYRRFYPNHYYLGYFMHTHISRNSGSDVWPKVVDRVSRGTSFTYSLKKHAGVTVRKAYSQTIEELQAEWGGDNYSLPISVETLPVKTHRAFTNYQHGHRMADGSVICAKYGLDVAPSIVQLLPDGKEKRIRALNNEIHLAAGGNKIVWASYRPDLRWGMQDFSDIMIMDMQSGEVRVLLAHGKFLSPALSPNGEKLAVVRYMEDGTHSLQVIEVTTGEVMFSQPFDEDMVLRTPSWSADASVIYYSITTPAGQQLNAYLLEDGKTSVILETSGENLSRPLATGGFLYFVTATDRANELHAVSISTGGRYVALSGGYGFFNPSVTSNGHEMLLDTYTSDGYRLVSWVPDTSKFIPYQSVQARKGYNDPVIKAEGHRDIFANYSPGTEPHKVKPFNHLVHGLRFHSWLFYPSYRGIKVEAVANDPLGIHTLAAGLEYNQNEKTTNQSVSYSLSRWFPVIGFSVSDGRRHVYHTQQDTMLSWNGSAFSGTVSFPLNLSREGFTHALQPAAGISYQMIRGMDQSLREVDMVGNGTFSDVSFSLDYLGHTMMASRDFFPSLGLAVDFLFRTTLTSSNYHGKIISGLATGYLPGLFPHHSLRVQLGYERQFIANNFDALYLYPLQYRYLRGYDAVFFERLNKLSVDYALPLLYPDLGLGPVAYFKRIRANLFADIGAGRLEPEPDLIRLFGLGKIGDKTFPMRSVGAELLVDMHLFRLSVEIDLGVRFSLTMEDEQKWEIISLQRF